MYPMERHETMAESPRAFCRAAGILSKSPCHAAFECSSTGEQAFVHHSQKIAGLVWQSVTVGYMGDQREAESRRSGSRYIMIYLDVLTTWSV